jgi:hypothetical protein
VKKPFPLKPVHGEFPTKTTLDWLLRNRESNGMAESSEGYIQLPSEEQLGVRCAGDSDFCALINSGRGEPIVLNQDLSRCVVMPDKPGEMFETSKPLSVGTFSSSFLLSCMRIS